MRLGGEGGPKKMCRARSSGDGGAEGYTSGVRSCAIARLAARAALLSALSSWSCGLSTEDQRTSDVKEGLGDGGESNER